MFKNTLESIRSKFSDDALALVYIYISFFSCPSVFDLNYLYTLFLCIELCPSEQGVQIGANFFIPHTWSCGVSEYCQPRLVAPVGNN